MMKKLRCFTRIFFGITLLLQATASFAMENPEIIQWSSGNPAFTNSVSQAVFGRQATQADWNLSRSHPGKMQFFLALVNTQEYVQRFGNLDRRYYVYWEAKLADRAQGGGKWMCHCYYFSKPSAGLMPAMQYTGVSMPSGPLTFPVARALTLMCGAYDDETCPDYSCGYSGDKSSGGTTPPPPSSTTNLVADPDFANFGNSSSPWGRNVLYGKNGIWWNSHNAQSTAKIVSLNGGNTPTALHIENRSSKSPHVYGTTAQRISVVKGRTYEVSFMGKAQNLASHGAINIAINPSWSIRAVSMSAGTYDWKKFTGTFKAPNNYIDLRILCEDRGNALITNMTLRAL